MASVLIPVPEEHVDEFNRYMLGLNMLGTGTLQRDALVAERERLPIVKRRFFDIVCQASAQGRRVSHTQIAEAVGIAKEDVLTYVMEINHQFQAGGAQPCVLVEADVSTLPDGTVTVEPMVLMLGAIAQALS